MTAYLDESGVPVVGVDVQAAVTSPSGVLSSITLVDQGDGTYVGSVPALECGYYQVVVTAATATGQRQDHAASVGGVAGSLLDPCVPDYDGDGLVDTLEAGATDPGLADSDGDLVADGVIAVPPVAPGPDNCPLVPNPDQSDIDGDALGDACEALSYGTDPGLRDTDGDGCADGVEVRAITFKPVLGGDRDPLDPDDFFDANGDGSIDLTDALIILSHFGHGPADDALDDVLDRDIPDPSKPWRTARSNTGVDLTDVLNNLQSFGHSCEGPP